MVEKMFWANDKAPDPLLHQLPTGSSFIRDFGKLRVIDGAPRQNIPIDYFFSWKDFFG